MCGCNTIYRKDGNNMKSKARVSANPNPMVDNRRIEKAIIDHGYSLESFANAIGLCYHTLRSRLDDGRWTVLEAWNTCQLLGLDFAETFFAYPNKVGRRVA